MQVLETLLRTEREQLRKELEDVRGSIAEAEQRLAAIIKRLRHVDGLLEDESTSPELQSSPAPAIVFRVHEARRLGGSVTDIAEAILAERQGEPMNYRELAEEVDRRGGDLGDHTGAATRLVARMVRDQRFVRPTSKGFYALRSDHPNVRSVGARRRQSPRRNQQ